MLSAYHFTELEEILTRETKPCIICGKPTKRVVLKNSSDEAAICSKSCQTKHFETLSLEKASRLQGLVSIDEKIAAVKKYEMCCWMAAGLGLIIIVLGITMARSLPKQQATIGIGLFLFGAIPLTVGALASEHFGGLRRKLMEKRQQII